MWLSDQIRLLALVGACAALWSVETLLPLYRYQPGHWRRALPNVALTALLMLTNVALSFLVANTAELSARHRVGLFFLFNLPPWSLALPGVLALDLSTYFAHVLLHKSRIGWQFHRVHHSDKEVNVTTAFRQHPGETVWRISWYVPAIITFGIPMWVVLLYLLISTLNAQLEHSNIRVNGRLDGLVRLLLVTPNMHKIHHSREQRQTDTNYANIFSLWDRLFGTYANNVNWAALRYGLDGFDEANRQTLAALLRTPFTREIKNA